MTFSLWQRVKHTGFVLVFIAVLTLLLLLALVGAVISHAPQGTAPRAVPHGGLMAPIDNPNDPPPNAGSIAVNNGDIQVGG